MKGKKGILLKKKMQNEVSLEPYLIHSSKVDKIHRPKTTKVLKRTAYSGLL